MYVLKKDILKKMSVFSLFTTFSVQYIWSNRKTENSVIG